MKTTTLKSTYWALITQRNYLPDYDEQGYQIGRHIEKKWTTLIQSDDFNEIEKAIDEIASGCDECYDCSIIESNSYKIMSRRIHDDQKGDSDE